jgi:hypothetical protein
MNNIEPNVEQEAIRIIGNLDFEKAFKIIYNGKIPSDAERGKECEKTGASRFNKLAYRFTEDSEPTEFEPSKIVDSKERVIEKRDAIIEAYEMQFKLLKEKTPDPEYNKALTKLTIYNTIIKNENNYNTLKQYPSDWRNLDLFADLWANAMLVKQWSKSASGPLSEMSQPLLATIYWCNEEPIPKSCGHIASQYKNNGKPWSADSLYKAYLKICQDTKHRRNLSRLEKVLTFLKKTDAIALCKKEIEESKKKSF